MTEHRLPVGLARLIANGVWPSGDGPSTNAQQLKPLVAAERVRRFAPEESLICLKPPPFFTVADEMAVSRTDFWERYGALDQIVPAQALIIGDFGLGSDAPVILDFARDALNPPVFRLCWMPHRSNEWVQGARDFDDFAQMLGLTEGLA